MGYNDVKRLFLNKNRSELLFHFTSLDAAIKIIASGKLLFMPQRSINDLNEAHRMISSPGHILAAKLEDYVKEFEHYKQISLTVDDLAINRRYRRGFDILPMWAHYANKGAGVCFVLRKDDIIEEANKQNAKYSPIKYLRDYHPAIDFESVDPIGELKEKTYEVFFRKSKEWEYEQEFRIIKRTDCPIDGLSVFGSIVAVIHASLGADKSSTPYDTANYLAINGALSTIMRLSAHPSIPLLRYSICDSFTDSNLSLPTSDGPEIVWQK